MVIMSTRGSRTTKTSFLCIALLASSNSWARHNYAWKIKSLATVSTKFSASSLTLNQSFPNPYKTSLLGVAFTRQETSNWQLKHRSFHISQIKSNIQGYGYKQNKVDDVVSIRFPKFNGSHEITNSSDYTTLGHGVMYTNIVKGKDEKAIEMGHKFDIDYTLFDEEKNYVHREYQKGITLGNLGEGLREGIKGMMSKGRRLIIVPRRPADPQHVNEGKYAIYDVTIENIHRQHLRERFWNWVAVRVHNLLK